MTQFASDVYWNHTSKGDDANGTNGEEMNNEIFIKEKEYTFEKLSPEWKKQAEARFCDACVNDGWYYVVFDGVVSHRHKNFEITGW